MTGHWERNGEEFHDLNEMWDYIVKNEEYLNEIDFERWINRNHTAAQVVFEMTDYKFTGSAWLKWWKRFEEAMWIPDVQDELVEGKDYYYGDNGDFEFKWVKNDE